MDVSRFNPERLSTISQSDPLRGPDPIKDVVGLYERDAGYMVGLNRGSAVEQLSIATPDGNGWGEAVSAYKQAAVRYKVMIRCRCCNTLFPTYALSDNLYCRGCGGE